MPWVAVEPIFKRGEVDRAGETIINPNVDILAYYDALQVVNNWRSSHSWPLNIFQTTLRSRVKGVDSVALVSQRLKRLASIEAKLRRFPNMKLSQMQDLGGCRAVLRNIDRVYDMAGVYERADANLLMGSALALREHTPLVPGTPTKRSELRQELAAIAQELNVETTLRGWRSALTYFRESGSSGDDVFLLMFDIEKWQVSVVGFKNEELEIATERYLAIEKEIADGANKQAVLVGVDSIDALRKAYPSYYVDTDAFLEALRRAMA